MLFFRKLTAVSAIALAGFAFGSACSSDDDSGDNPGGGGTGNSGSGATGNNGTGDTTGSSGDGTGATGTGGTNNTTGGTTNNTAGDGAIGVAGAGTTTVDCGGPCQCNDGIDNDDDGTTDGFDVECQGPLDNDEGSFATGIPGDNRDESWVDCFFDGDSGAGNDGCKYPYECLTGELDINSDDCALATSQQCIDYCGPRTPNGCDCFGCCAITLSSGDTVNIFTLSGCDLENIDDEMACPRCELQTDCQNTCGECELCPGRTVDDLPESCMPSGEGGAGGNPPTYTCEGADVCTDTVPCPGGYYCSFGCCIPYVK